MANAKADSKAFQSLYQGYYPASKSKDGLEKKQGKKSKKLQLVSSTDSARSTSSPVMLKGKPIVLSEEVQQSIDLVVEAFLFFDRDGDGVIDRNEVISTFDTEAGECKAARVERCGGAVAFDAFA